MQGTTRRTVHEKLRELIDPQAEKPSIIQLIQAMNLRRGNVPPPASATQKPLESDNSNTANQEIGISSNTKQVNTALFNPTQQFNPFTLE